MNSNTTSSSSSSSTTNIQSQSTIVKLSQAPSSGSARTSSPIVNVTLIKKYRDEPSISRTPDVPTNTSSSVSGLKFAFESQTSHHQPSITSGLVINTAAPTYQHSTLKDSPPSSPSGSELSARKRRKGTPQQSPQDTVFDLKREREEKDSKSLQNGAVSGTLAFSTHHMLGNQLNPSSSAAKSMAETLNMEIDAHNIYTSEVQPNLIGPQYPGRKDLVGDLITQLK